MECLNTDWAAVHKQVFCQVVLQSVLQDAQVALSWFEVRCRSVRKHAKATEHHLLQVAQECTVTQAKLVHEISCSRGSEVALLYTLHAFPDQSSIAANRR